MYQNTLLSLINFHGKFSYLGSTGNFIDGLVLVTHYPYLTYRKLWRSLDSSAYCVENILATQGKRFVISSRLLGRISFQIRVILRKKNDITVVNKICNFSFLSYIWPIELNDMMTRVHIFVYDPNIRFVP